MKLECPVHGWSGGFWGAVKHQWLLYMAGRSVFVKPCLLRFQEEGAE